MLFTMMITYNEGSEAAIACSLSDLVHDVFNIELKGIKPNSHYK